MFSFLRSDPVKKLNKLHERKLEEAMHAQRNGDIKGYSMLTYEADELHKQILKIQENLKPS